MFCVFESEWRARGCVCVCVVSMGVCGRLHMHVCMCKFACAHVYVIMYVRCQCVYSRLYVFVHLLIWVNLIHICILSSTQEQPPGVSP